MEKPDDSPPLIPLSLVNWGNWNDEVTTARGLTDNERVINSNGRITGTASLYNATLNNLQSRTLVLFFSNTTASTYNDGRMIKVHYNHEDFLLLPDNEPNIRAGEYLPASDTPFERGIEFTIPPYFDGRLSFVFYEADLNDFVLTAYYR
jgi:hypothetical protein